MNMDIQRIMILIVFALSGCNSTPPPAAATDDDISSEPTTMLVIPTPPSFFPTPYKGAKFAPINKESVDYARYLAHTEMFPDTGVCERNLMGNLRGGSIVGSIDWVTRPYLAWGGIRDNGTVVGPVRFLFSIKEAHVSYQIEDGPRHDFTYSCYVQYAAQWEKKIWRKGFLKYGEGITQGHRRYVPTRVNTFDSSPPGKTNDWEPGIKYYREKRPDGDA